MKKLLFFSITIIAIYASLIETAMAAPASAKIYCKYTSKGTMSIYDVQTEEGHFACQEPLKLGAACYLGTRKAKSQVKTHPFRTLANRSTIILSCSAWAESSSEAAADSSEMAAFV